MNLHCTTLEQMTAINQNVHQKEKNAKLYTLTITIQQFNLYRLIQPVSTWLTLTMLNLKTTC